MSKRKGRKSTPAPSRPQYLSFLSGFCNERSVLRLIREAIRDAESNPPSERTDYAKAVLGKRGGEVIDHAKEFSADDLLMLAEGVVVGAAMMEVMIGHLVQPGAAKLAADPHRGVREGVRRKKEVQNWMRKEMKAGTDPDAIPALALREFKHYDYKLSTMKAYLNEVS